MKPGKEIPKDNPFRVPEGYFDRLTERTMSAIRDENRKAEAAWETPLSGLAAGETSVSAEARAEITAGETSGKTGRGIRLMPYLALAAAIVGFALLATVIIRVVTADRASAKFTDENSLYADLLIDELDTYMIEDELFMTESAAATGTEEAIAPETIIDYLMTEDIDLDDIYELL